MASSGVRIRASALVLAINTPAYCPVVSMGLSNQSTWCWMEWTATTPFPTSVATDRRLAYIVFKSSTVYW